ncbi:MAG: hypothetical protein JW941_04210 [Candidatus Coatesbacteria bacterium]|nr:hypothetical protein [Candidatus Coatesbacteria bacterium]
MQHSEAGRCPKGSKPRERTYRAAIAAFDITVSGKLHDDGIELDFDGTRCPYRGLLGYTKLSYHQGL